MCFLKASGALENVLILADVAKARRKTPVLGRCSGAPAGRAFTTIYTTNGILT